MKINEEDQGGRKESQAEGAKLTLRFVCPKCGSGDLRETMLEVSYPIRLIEKIEVNPDDLEDIEVFDNGDEEYYHTGDMHGCQYSCEGCGMELTYEEDGKELEVENEFQLVQWLLKHRPQSTEDVPVTEGEPKKD